MATVRPDDGSHSLVSCRTSPPARTIALWRSISCWSARCRNRNEFRFLTSVRVIRPAAPGRPHRHVRVAAQAALLHVPVAGADLDEDRAQPLEERRRVRRGPDVGRRDDLDQGHPAPIEVNVAPPVGVGEALVEQLACVLFEVHAGDAHAVPDAPDHVLETPVHGKRLIVLGDLIPFGKVRIEVVLPREHRDRRDAAARVPAPRQWRDRPRRC